MADDGDETEDFFDQDKDSDEAVIEHCMENIIRKHLDDQLYREDKVPEWIDRIIRDIGTELKGMDFLARHKRVINVNILHWTESTNITTDSQCFWDEETDRMISYTYRNGSILCSAVVFFVHVY